MTEPSPNTVMGIVKDIKNGFLTVIEEETKKEIKVRYLDKLNLPIRKGDSIFFLEKEGVVLDLPTAQPPKNEKMVKDGIKRQMIMKCEGNMAKAFVQTDHLIRVFSREGSLIRSVSEFSDDYYRRKDSRILSSLIEKMDIPKDCEVDPQHINNVLMWYARDFLTRKFYLLGISRKTLRTLIKEDYTLAELYDIVCKFPFRLISLTREELENILKITRNFEINTAENMKIFDWLQSISRKMENGGYCAYPLKDQSINTSAEILQKKFRISFKNIDKDNFLLTDFQSKNLFVIKELLLKCRIEDPLEIEEQEGLDKDQEEAVKIAARYSLCCVTGRAGTGKSTTIRALVKMFMKNGLSIVIASFTGKAVARDREILKGLTDQVTTIHMLLGALKKGLRPNVVIIDEASMLSTPLFSKLCRCILLNKDDIRLVFIGDINQLLPIEYGNIFTAMMDKKSEVSTVVLNTDHRREQSEDGKLPDVLEYAIQGLVYTKDSPDYGISFLKGESYVEELVNTYMDMKIADTELTILVPYVKCLTLNEIFRNKLKDQPSITDAWGNVWYVGHRIMAKTNRYDIDVMNGEEGRILHVDTEQGFVSCQFGENVYDIPTTNTTEVKEFSDNIDEIEDPLSKVPLSTQVICESWCITIHKSQGSEWNYVILYIPDTSSNFFITRNLYYTACSRAKKRLDVISGVSCPALQKLVKNIPSHRYYQIETL